MNRSMDGDIVAVELLPEVSPWLALFKAHFHHYTKLSKLTLNSKHSQWTLIQHL